MRWPRSMPSHDARCSCRRLWPMPSSGSFWRKRARPNGPTDCRPSRPWPTRQQMGPRLRWIGFVGKARQKIRNRETHSKPDPRPRPPETRANLTRDLSRKARLRPRPHRATDGNLAEIRHSLDMGNRDDCRWRGDRDSNPGDALTPNGFQDRRIRPLCHLPARPGQGPGRPRSGMSSLARFRRTSAVRQAVSGKPVRSIAWTFLDDTGALW